MQRSEVHVGIAADTERGLVVPVRPRRARARASATRRRDHASRPRPRAPARSTPDELTGATIAVSNTGSYGSEAGTPILSPGTSVTLAIGVIAPRALVVDGAVVARPACTLSCTFDHRVLDGAVVGRALTDLVETLDIDRTTGRLAAMKIVSLLPSATEIVYALGLGDDLVGVTDECDFPPDAVTKPVVSRSALPQGRPLTSREIDAAVRERMDARRPLYVLDTDLIRREQPDVILTQDLCRVCAVPAGHVEEALAAARTHRRTKVVSLDPNTLDEVIGQIEIVGKLLGAEDGRRRARGRTPRTRRRGAADRRAPSDRERALPGVGASRRSSPATGCPRWSRRSAQRTCSGEKGEPSRTVTHREIRDAYPEVLMYMPCGYYLEEAEAEGGQVARAP